MRYLLFFVIPMVAGCTGNFGQPDVPPEEEKARLKIFEMGGAAHRTKAPGYPVRDVYLLGCKDIDDDSLSIVTNFPHVRNLTLSYTKITDKGLRHLRGLKELRSLALCFTGISDAGLAHFKELTQLETLTVVQTKVTASGADTLQKALPKLKISR